MFLIRGFSISNNGSVWTDIINSSSVDLYQIIIPIQFDTKLSTKIDPWVVMDPFKLITCRLICIRDALDLDHFYDRL